MEYSPVRDFHHGTRVTAIGWAPDTSLLTVPKVLRFATGGSDRKLRIFQSDLKSDHNVKVKNIHFYLLKMIIFSPAVAVNKSTSPHPT